jgi:hypothetical protein
MRFPIHLRVHKRIRIRTGDLTDLRRNNILDSIERGLYKKRARRILRGVDTIRFTAGWFRWPPPSRWNLLLPIGSGTITVDIAPDAILVDYQIDFLEHFVFVSTFVAALWYFSFCHNSTDPCIFVLPALVAMWLAFVAGNALIGVFRFYDFIQDCIRLAA